MGSMLVGRPLLDVRFSRKKSISVAFIVPRDCKLIKILFTIDIINKCVHFQGFFADCLVQIRKIGGARHIGLKSQIICINSNCLELFLLLSQIWEKANS